MAKWDAVEFLVNESVWTHRDVCELTGIGTPKLLQWHNRYGQLLGAYGGVVGGEGTGNHRLYTAHGLMIIKFAQDIAAIGVETMRAIGWATEIFAVLFRERVGEPMRRGVDHMTLAEALNFTGVLVQPIADRPLSPAVSLHDIRQPFDGRHYLTTPARIGFSYPAGAVTIELMNAAAKLARVETAAPRPVRRSEIERAAPAAFGEPA